MFGKEYSLHPEILLDSFEKMNDLYERKVKNQQSILRKLQQQYIRLFGIPEIGFQERFLFANKILSKLQGKRGIKRILDAGTGIGVYAFWLSNKFPKAEIVGWDTDREKIAFCNIMKKKLGKQKLSFLYKDLVKTNKGKKFSLIVHIDVLEHIRQYKKVLKNFYVLLEKDGYLYIHTPQPNQKRIFKASEYWHHEGHVVEGYTPEQLGKVLTELRFRVVIMEETFGILGKFAWEVHHMLLAKSVALAALTFPFLYIFIMIDTLYPHSNGWGTAILVRK